MEISSLHDYYICLGSNYNARKNIKRVEKWIESEFSVAFFGRIIRTKGIDVDFECWYLNQVVRIKSSLDIDTMNRKLKAEERDVGRIHNDKRVAIDIDIVKYDGVVVHKKFDEFYFLSMLCDELEQSEIKQK